jgi:hypothetical protein
VGTRTLAIEPIDPGALAQRMRDWMPVLLAHAGIPHLRLTHTDDRTWTPMDHTVPPDCPFVDSTVWAAEGGDKGSVSLRLERAHWNPDDIARTSVDLVCRRGSEHFAVSAWAEGSGARVGELVIVGDLPDEVSALLGPLLN